MIVLALIAVVLICGLVAYRFCCCRADEPPPILDSEEAVKAAIELHAIRRRLDVSLMRSEQRRGAERMRRNIDRALDEFDDRS